MKNIFRILVVAMLFSSCYVQQIQQAQTEAQNTLNSLLGKSKSQVVLTLGVPTNKQILDGIEVWTYYKELYQRQSANANVNVSTYYNYGNAYGNGNRYSYAAYQKSTLYFQNEVVVRWYYEDKY